VEDQNSWQNYHLFDSHKTIDPTEGSPEEDSPEDSLEAEDFPEVEDSLEVEDTQEEEEYHLEDRREEVGDRHHCLCHKPIKENW